MEDSNSDTFNSNAPAQSSSTDHENLDESFERLGFVEYSPFETQPVTYQSHSATNVFDSFSLHDPFAAQTQERVDHVFHAQPTRRFSDPLPMNNRVDIHDMTRYSSRNLFPRGNILESQDFTKYGGGDQVPVLPHGLERRLVSNDHSQECLDNRRREWTPTQYMRGHYDRFQEIGNAGYRLPGRYNWNNYGESSSGLLNQRVAGYGDLKSENLQLGRDNRGGNNILGSQDFINYGGDNQVPILPCRLVLDLNDHSHVAPNQYIRGHYDRFQEIGNERNCLPGGHNWNNYGESSFGLLNQVGDYGGPKSKNVQLGRDNSIMMVENLKMRNPEETQKILNCFYHCIVELMKDNHGKYVFEQLLETCNENQLNSIMCKLEVEQTSFMRAAFTVNGAISIERLIRKVKRTRHASTITKILSTEFRELMMHRTGMRVIQACLEHFGVEENEVLFNEAITHCVPLAKDKMGCISLNACINSVTGSCRERLLNVIAEASLDLSNDLYGNYVVQNVLSLRDEQSTSRICGHLQDQYASLSCKKQGAYVVRRCIELSQLGMTFAVKEIVKNGKAFELATDPYGNYVIQLALKQTWIRNRMLYDSLVMALEPYHANLEKSAHGRHVLSIIQMKSKFKNA